MAIARHVRKGEGLRAAAHDQTIYRGLSGVKAPAKKKATGPAAVRSTSGAARGTVGGMSHPTEPTANKVSHLLGLDDAQTQVIRDLGAALGDPRAFLREITPLLSARRYRVLIWGIQGIGKTRAIRQLGAALSRPIMILDTDQDAASTGAAGVIREELAFPPAPTLDPAQLRQHILATLTQVNNAVSAAQARLRSAEISGAVLDTISALHDTLWGDFALTDLDKLGEGVVNRGGGGRQGQMASASVVSLIQTTLIRLWRAGDYRSGNALSEAPQAPGPYIVGALAHARSIPKINDKGDAIMNSHSHYEIKIGQAIRTTVLGTVDFALGYGLKREPGAATRAQDRTFTFDDLVHPHVKGRVAEAEDDPEERKIATAAANKGDLTGLVLGLYKRRIDRALERAQRTAAAARAK